MDLNKYRVDVMVCCEKDGQTHRHPGYQIVFAGSPESAKLVAKARVLESLKKQGYKIIFLEFKDAVKDEPDPYLNEGDDNVGFETNSNKRRKDGKREETAEPG